MKTIEQIKKYTSNCQFPDEDWQLVNAYCKENYDGKKTNKSQHQLFMSTYQDFLQWVEHGFGSGDIVRYGHTLGVLDVVTKDKSVFSAFRDYEGNLIKDKLEVMTEKLFEASDEEKSGFLKLLNDNGYDIFASTLVDLYVPKPDSYVSGKRLDNNESFVALFAGYDEEFCVFRVYYNYRSVKFDLCIERSKVHLHPAGASQAKTLHGATANHGYTYNARTNKFIKISETTKPKANKYWYISERFTVLADVDNGSEKHKQRYEAGNYFIDQMEAVLFAKAITEMRER